MRRSIGKRVACRTPILLLALALLCVLAGCSDGERAPRADSTAAGAEPPTPIRVVVTTNIVADWVENVGGDHVEVFSIVPVGADPHGFQPGARDVTKVADADLVLSVGLSLEESWLRDLLENAARDPGAIVELGQVVDPIEFAETEAEEGDEEHDDHGHGIHDPHFWFDPLRVKLVVSDIAARLAALDPGRADAYRANADAYNARLDALHAWTEEQVGAIPAERRLLVTSHDSLGYFAERYGFEVVGVILSITTEVEPSAAALIELTDEVGKYGVPAVFGETTVSERLADALATESGAVLVRLYSGSLGTEGSGAETYIEMVRTNVGRVTEALR